MTTFDQRGQTVHGDQYNAGHDINFGTVHSFQDFAAQLEKLRNQVVKSVEQGTLDKDTAIDVESHLKKASTQANKPSPDKKTILQNIEEAKALIGGITTASSMVGALAQAAQAIQKLF